MLKRNPRCRKTQNQKPGAGGCRAGRLVSESVSEPEHEERRKMRKCWKRKKKVSASAGQASKLVKYLIGVALVDILVIVLSSR
jgi:hypothetical protein